MKETFSVVYHSAGGLDVRLEAAERADAAGLPYLHHRLVVGEGRRGAVVLAVRAEHVLLVRSERVAAGAEFWEFPRGAGEPVDTDATVTADRELREETGLRGRSARLVGEYITDSTVFPQPVAVVELTVAQDDQGDAGDGEIAGRRWVPIVHLNDLIRSGVIRDAHSLAALALWRVPQEDDHE